MKSSPETAAGYVALPPDRTQADDAAAAGLAFERTLAFLRPRPRPAGR